MARQHYQKKMLTNGKEAEANAAADKEKAANIETKNQADSICYQTKQLEELESKIDASEKEKLSLY